MTILYCSRISDWKRLEKTTVEEFLIRWSGQATYVKLWKPLLLAKLGENYRRVSAVFIWTYVKRMFSARDSSASKEQMGHVRGGYKTVFDRLESTIAQAGGDVRLGVAVNGIVPAEKGPGINILTDAGFEHFDKVIFTGPVNVLQKLADERLVRLHESGQQVEYLGVQCMALVTKRPLMPYYILNIADRRIPFTGVVGMSNIVDTSETAGYHLTYLPKYMLSTDKELQRPEAEVRGEFLEALRLIFPEIDDTDIISARVHKAYKVQPLQVLDFSKITPRTETRHPDFFVHNTAQFVNNTLNNNEVIRAVDAFLSAYGSRLESASSTTAVSTST